MKYCLKYARRFFFVAILTCVVMLLYQNSEAAAPKGMTGNISGHRLPVTQENGSLLLASAMNDNELLTDVVSYYIMNRSQQANRMVSGFIFYTLAILLLGYWIQIQSSRYVKRDNKQQIPVLAISMGGHAPPKLSGN